MKRTSTEVPAHFDLFVDSAGFIAVMNDRDPTHEKAIELWNLSIETGKLLVTSNFVIGETYTWMRRRSNLYF